MDNIQSIFSNEQRIRIIERRLYRGMSIKVLDDDHVQIISCDGLIMFEGTIEKAHIYWFSK